MTDEWDGPLWQVLAILFLVFDFKENFDVWFPILGIIIGRHIVLIFKSIGVERHVKGSQIQCKCAFDYGNFYMAVYKCTIWSSLRNNERL